MGRPAHPSMTAAERGPTPKAHLDAIEMTQAVQDLSESVPLVARKRTLVRAYLGLQSGALNVEGELRVSRKPHGPWISIPSAGVAQLDGTRKGTSLADLKTRRDTLGYSLNFLLPPKLTLKGKLWLRLHKVREVGSGHPVHVDDSIGLRTATFEPSPPLRLRVINLRYATGSPAVTYAATASDLAHLRSWLRRAYPVPNLVFASVTIDATAAWPFTSGQANAQLAAIRALDMAGGGDQKTHYYGMVADGGGFMRGSAAGIPGTPDPATVASGPTGSNNWVGTTTVRTATGTAATSSVTRSVASIPASAASLTMTRHIRSLPDSLRTPTTPSSASTSATRRSGSARLRFQGRDGTT